MELLIATGNAGKAREFEEILQSATFHLTSLIGRQFTPIEETGRTFRENACLKAAGYAQQFGQWTLADDSGLEVAALHGRPGVLSARWAEANGIGSGDRDNIRALQRQLADINPTDRSARFVCVVALANPEGTVILTVRDTMEGRILPEPRGSNGFGYDPLFYLEELARTAAELSPAEKHRISHRGKALRRMRELMERVNLPHE